MAVIDQLTVEIKSGNVTLQEYEVPEDEQVDRDSRDRPPPNKQVVKYLEAVSNSEFEIKCAVTQGFEFGDADYLSFRIYVDGKFVAGEHVYKAKYLARSKGRVTCTGFRAFVDGKWHRFPFTWAELVTTDEDPTQTLAELSQQYGELGTIRVEVWRKKGTKSRPMRPRALPPGDAKIPEKALKGEAIDLAIRRGKPRDVRNLNTLVSEKLDPRPLARLLFKYRSKRALQVLGVLPRSPSPVPLEHRDLATLTHEEALELLRQQQTRPEAADTKVKSENIEDSLPQLAAIKREAPDEEGDLHFVAQRSKRTRQEIETIDLTND